MDFEFGWNPAKEEWTIRERGISFRYAATVFLDEHRVEAFSRHQGGEDRYHTIGRTPADEILFVVYTWRPDEQENPICWIISARKANKSERKHYPRVREDPGF
ncbi:MAG: BrnT family toxin [Acidobacteriaceae bacterium]|nr:BrnT family toxin [Acidobacteriaceae bacterium]